MYQKTKTDKNFYIKSLKEVLFILTLKDVMDISLVQTFNGKYEINIRFEDGDFGYICENKLDNGKIVWTLLINGIVFDELTDAEFSILRPVRINNFSEYINHIHFLEKYREAELRNPDIREEIFSYLDFAISDDFQMVMTTQGIDDFVIDKSIDRVYCNRELYTVQSYVTFIKSISGNYALVFKSSLN